MGKIIEFTTQVGAEQAGVVCNAAKIEDCFEQTFSDIFPASCSDSCLTETMVENHSQGILFVDRHEVNNRMNRVGQLVRNNLGSQFSDETLSILQNIILGVSALK
jgi:hypothetical protein